MDCTIIIFHYESLGYLRACIRQIRKYENPFIKQRVIIAEQSTDSHIRMSVLNEFSDMSDIFVVTMPKYGSGFAIDFIMRNINISTEFLCTIDVDTMPIHKNWLYVPIKLIKEDGFSFVGVHAEIEGAYAYMGDFFCLAQYFRVGRTSDFLLLSLNGGFTKSDFRDKLSFENTEWHGWSDDAVPAQWWEDKYTKHFKLALAVTHYLGIAPLEGRYGRFTDGLVFHFAFSYNWKMVADKESAMGQAFLDLMKEIDNNGLSDELIADILSKLIPLEAPIPRQGWDGDKKIILKPIDKLNKRIEELKKA